MNLFVFFIKCKKKKKTLKIFHRILNMLHFFLWVPRRSIRSTQRYKTVTYTRPFYAVYSGIWSFIIWARIGKKTNKRLYLILN